MIRALIATEGPSDEPVAEHLVRRSFSSLDLEIDRKRFPNRGIEVVQKLLESIICAAHFGYYDLVVIHFDLDDTVDPERESIVESERWREIDEKSRETLGDLPDAGRRKELRIALMAPCQTTEAWLAWGLENEDGRLWGKVDRKKLKRKFYDHTKRTESVAPDLIAQMDTNDDWPPSLRLFVDQLESTA